MKSYSAAAGQRADHLVPAYKAQAIAAAMGQDGPLLTEDMKLFLMTFVGGLIFFGTFLS